MTNKNTAPPQEMLTYGVKDQALLRLVALANHEVSMGVTLILEGKVLYGDLMSGQEYCNLTASGIRNAGGDSGKEMLEVIANFFDELSTDYISGTDKIIPLNFLHLKNVAYLGADGKILPVINSVFRIFIDKVSGFAVGRPSY